MSVRIINADVLAGLAELPDESVHCVVTSPPYWGLRDYGTANWEGGETGCDHEPPAEWLQKNFSNATGLNGGDKTVAAAAKGRWYQKDGSCRCGATRVDRQIGLEATPEQFVSRMVEVFREVRRVLRKDGTCWLNLGDSYSAKAAGKCLDPHKTSGLAGKGTQINAREHKTGWDAAEASGLPIKNLIGIPWRVALALQADGWWLRSEIIWHKPNPMPESVTDRPTKAHEQIFLLTKAERYYFDAEAIKEAATPQDRTGKVGYLVPKHEASVNQGLRLAGGPKSSLNGPSGDSRNARSVWTIATAPFAEAHFATFPPELPAKCIKAGCPKGGTVLDPFGGAGTTGLVADRLQRNAVLIELNPEYAAMASNRIANDAGGLFASVDVQKPAEVQMPLLEAAE
jgi:DNA modification methylase